MSWSVSAVGKPANVKAALATQFESAKRATATIPEEQAQVVGIEQGVNAQLDFAIANEVGAIRVEASGSYCRGSKSELRTYPGSCETKLVVQSIYGLWD